MSLSRLGPLTVAIALLTLVPALAAAQVPNDECSAAIPIKRVPSTQTLAVETATIGATDPESSCAGGGPNVWYTYTARSDVSLELDATASTYRAGITVYTGECGALTETTCLERSSDGGPAHLVLQLRTGDVVRIAVTTRDDPGSTLSLVARKSDPRYRPAKSVAEIVRSSDPSPYGGAQGLLSATVATDEKTTVFAQSTFALVVDVGGVLTTIAHTGSPSPAGGTFASFRPPVMSTTSAYFIAQIENGPIGEGIFKWNGAAVESVLLPGSPGPAGTTLRDFGTGLAVSDTGIVAFFGRTVGHNDLKLMRFDGTTVTVLAAPDQASPCGGTIRKFETPLAIDGAGNRVVFAADVRTPTGSGVFLSEAGGVTAVACRGDGTPLGGQHRSFGTRPAVNDLGEVYFLSDVNGGVGTALWMWSGGVTTAVAIEDMVLASGETIRNLSASQPIATNAAGDVVFRVDLVKLGRGIAQRAHLAPLPATIVRHSDACPLGGTFEDIDDEVNLSDAGEVVFDANCSGGRGAFRKPLASGPITVASGTSTTAIGSGLTFGSLAINGAGTRVTSFGFRTTLQRITCTRKGCSPPVPLLAPGAPIANAPGETLAGIDTETLAGNADTLAFLGVTVGTNHRRAVLRLQKGALEVVASEAGPLPDGVGAFLGFPLDGSVAQTTGTIGVGKGIVAFLADIEHPTATRGIFAATKDGVRAVVLTGDPAPRGTVFIDLGMPTVRQRSIVFPGTTDDGPACLFATAAPGKPFTAVACLDDPVPAPIGGAISDFLTLPSGIASDLYVPIAVQGGTRDECLVRVQKKKTSVIRCRDDVYVGGLFYGSFEDAGIGITTDAKGKNLLGLMQDNSVNAEVLLATQGKTIVSLLTSEVTAAPTSGGSISPSSGTLAGSIAGKTVVLAGGINGGSAAMAIFRFVLP